MKHRFPLGVVALASFIGLISGIILTWPQPIHFIARDEALRIGADYGREQCLNPPGPPGRKRDPKDCDHVERTDVSEDEGGWLIDYRIVKRRVEFSLLVNRIGQTESTSYEDYNDYPPELNRKPPWEQPRSPVVWRCGPPPDCSRPEMDRAIRALYPGAGKNQITEFEWQLYRAGAKQPPTPTNPKRLDHSAAAR